MSQPLTVAHRCGRLAYPKLVFAKLAPLRKVWGGGRKKNKLVTQATRWELWDEKRVSSSANSRWSRCEVAKELSQPLANPEPDLTAPQANQIGIWPRTMGDNWHGEKSFSRLRRLKLHFTWSIVFVRACTGGVPPVPLCHCKGSHGTSCISCGLDNIYIYLYSRPSRPHMAIWWELALKPPLQGAGRP